MRHVAIALTMLALTGCGSIIGLDGYTDAVDGGLDASMDTGGDAIGADVAPVKDSASDATDAAADVVVEACVPVAEDCTNGIDDDCNGLADCLDPACTTGYACVPPLPNGWTLTAYERDQRAACATGYQNAVDVEEGINAPAATCGCGCTTTNPTCTGGNVSITGGGNVACDNVTKQTDTAAAGCNALTQFATNNQSISVQGPAPTGGSCATNPAKTVPAVTYQHQGRTCDYTGKAGGGCSNGNVCAPSAATASTCVSQAGTQTCPSGFPVQHLIGSTLTDTRSCSACTCAFNAGTCNGAATFYTDNNCTQNATSVTVDSACHGVGNRTWRTYKYAPANAASCTPAAATPTGVTAFANLATVCCTN